MTPQKQDKNIIMALDGGGGPYPKYTKQLKYDMASFERLFSIIPYQFDFIFSIVIL